MSVPNLAWASLTIPPARTLNGRADPGRQLSAAGARSVVPLIYGLDRVGGLVLNVIRHATDSTLYHVQVLWGFAVHAVSVVKLNGLDLPAGSSVTHYADGTQTTANAALVAAFAAQSISYIDTLQGYAYSVFTLPSASFTGELQFTAQVQGRRLYDPRKDSTAGGTGSHRLATPSTWEYSDCPALALGDFLRSAVYGAGREVDTASLIAAANANDALVGSPAEKRRTIGIAFVAPGSVNDTAEALRAYAGCFMVPSEGGIKLVPDADASPVASYSHFLGQIASISGLSLRDLGNSPTVVEVIYTDTAQIPWRDASAFAELPGAGTTLPYRLTQVRMPGVQRYSQARREAIERLNKLTLQDLSCTLEVFDIGIRHEPGDIVQVTHPVGITSKLFRVLEPSMPSPGRWMLPLVEHDPSCYSSVVETAPTYANSGAVISEAPAVPPGEDGLSTYTATIYRQSATQPTPASGGSYTFEGDVFVAPAGTSREIPETGSNPTWATSYTFQTRTPAVPVPGPLGSPDADFASVKLLVAGVSSLADTGPLGLTPSTSGSITFSNTIPLFGQAAMVFGTTTPFARWSSRSDWDLNRTAWTLEIWAYEPSTSPGVTASQGTLMCRRNGGAFGFTNGWAWLTFGLRARINGSWSDAALSWSRPSLDTWHHYRLVKSGANLIMFVDGQIVASRNDVTSWDDVASTLDLGVGDSGSGENPFRGRMGQWRISHIARSTTAFTVPDQPWPVGGTGGAGWPAWTRVLRDGAGGTNGIVVFAYQRSASGTPALPSATATYTFATATLTGLNNGWSASIPGGSDALYVTAATARSADATDSIPASEWAAAQLIGGSGGTAINSAPVLLFRRTSNATPPAGLSAPVTYTFATGVASGLTNGWQQSLPTTGGGYRWVINATALNAGSTDTIPETEFSAVALLAEDGAGQGVDVIFVRAANQPIIPSPSSGVPSGWYGRVEDVPSGTDTLWSSYGERENPSSNWVWQAPLRYLQTVRTGDMEPNAATDVTMDVYDFAGATAGVGTVVHRTIVMTPAVDCWVEFSAQIAATNVVGDAGNRLGWGVTPAGGSRIILGSTQVNTTAKQSITAVNAFQATAGVALTFDLTTERASGNPAQALYESYMRIILIKR